MLFSLVACLVLSSDVSVKYIGTAGWELRSGATTILVDPYYTRVASTNDDDLIAPDAAAIAKYAPATAALILVSHTHWDHALDAPAVARRTGAPVLGSDNTRTYARAYGLDDKSIIPVRGGEDYAFDGFSVRVIPSLHSALYGKHWLDKESIVPGMTLPAKHRDFHPGEAFAFLIRIGGRKLLFVSSANFIEREIEGVHADVAFIAPGLRREIYDYTCRLMRAAGAPKLVFPTHFDDFTIPFDAAIAKYATTVSEQKAFVDEVKACSPGTEVRVPRHLETIRLP